MLSWLTATCWSCLLFLPFFNNWRSYCFYNCHHRGKLFLFYYQAIVCKSFIKLILSSSPTLNFHRFRYSLPFYKDANSSEKDWIRRSWGATTSISAKLWLEQSKNASVLFLKPLWAKSFSEVRVFKAAIFMWNR